MKKNSMQNTTARASSQPTLSVGELAKRAGVAVSALHFYERRGLIASYRSTGNQRRFPRSMLRRVSVIKAAQSLGLSLDEVADALAVLPEDRAPSSAEWDAMAQHWRANLDMRIKRLELLRDLLSGCIGCGCLSTEICPLRNPEDKLAAYGAGPHFLDPDILAEEVARVMAASERNRPG